ncbi:uncharacterized protein LOC141674392 [Apium graveolens]|uniref:uncharacterized protein LOC141674392 n=1 Tax=Apium graveolens TaxID=4045 RepID=UPI003D7B83FD
MPDACSDSTTAPRDASISTPIHFAMLGMDKLGPFPMASGHRKLIVVAIDNFTKWIEAKALTKITIKQITLFSGHRKLIVVAIDNFTKWIEAEALTKITIKQITQFFWENVICRCTPTRNTWIDELFPILWAYHTTCKVMTEATPFMLPYGAETVVTLKITHGSPRVEAYEPETNEESMGLVLDLIDEVRDEVNARNVEPQQRASLYYDRRVKERFFQQGDPVLRKFEVSGVGEREKLAPNWEGPYKVKKTLGRGSYKLETLNGDEVPHVWHASNLKVYYI